MPIKLDITRADEVAAAASRCTDVNVLINNAGVARFKPALGAPAMDDARLEMETNYFGTLAMCRAFAPVLKTNGGGALVNMLSVVSFMNVPMQGSYSASKAAEWSLTKAVRFELRAQGTLVIGVYAGYIDTDMTTGIAGPKSSSRRHRRPRHRRYRRRHGGHPRGSAFARGVRHAAQGRSRLRRQYAETLGQGELKRRHRVIRRQIRSITMKKFILVLALLASASTAVLAQSQPNLGPNGNHGGDTYGKPYSGSAGARQSSHGTS